MRKEHCQIVLKNMFMPLDCSLKFKKCKKLEQKIEKKIRKKQSF